MRPYPHVGFKYHAFMVLHAVHLTTRLVNLARQLVVERNGGYHDYKFAEAAFENAAAMVSPWRERYLAASVLYLNGSADKPNEAVARARALLS